MTNYVAMWPGGTIVKWRNLTMSEYKKIEQKYLTSVMYIANPMDVYLWVYNTVKILGPSEEEVSAGIVVFIAEHQLKDNPFNGTYNDIFNQLQVARNKIDSSYIETAKCIIAAAFKYSFEEIETWDPIRFFEMIARAEKVMGRLVDPVKPDSKKPLLIPESAKREAKQRVSRKR